MMILPKLTIWLVHVPRKRSLSFSFTGIGIASGEVWKRQRKFTFNIFRNLGLGKSSFESIIVKECQKLATEITRQDKDAFNPLIPFSNATSNVICSFAFGIRYEYTNSKFKFLLNSIHDIEKSLRDVGAMQLLLPMAAYIPTKGRYKLVRLLTELRQFVDTVIEEHKPNFDSDSPRDYIDIFMHEIQSSNDGLLTYEHLQSNVISFFFAGGGSTAHTLRWTMYCIVRYPEVQKAVQNELDKVVGRERMPLMSDKDFLPYTMATLLEVQRFASIAKISPLHAAACDTELCGYLVPKGTYLISNFWAVHHDPTIWKDPEDFKPERFLTHDGKVKQPREFIPFGFGKYN